MTEINVRSGLSLHRLRAYALWIGGGSVPGKSHSAEWNTTSDALAAVSALLAVGVGAMLAVQTFDPVMRFHATLLICAGLIAAFVVVGKTFGEDEAAPVDQAGSQLLVYSDGVIKAGVIATVFWGVVGFLVGDILAWQLAFPALNLDLP